MKTNLVTLVIILTFGIEACSTTYVLTKVPQQTPPFTTQYASYEELMAKADGKIVTVFRRDGNHVAFPIPCRCDCIRLLPAGNERDRIASFPAIRGVYPPVYSFFRKRQYRSEKRGTPLRCFWVYQTRRIGEKTDHESVMTDPVGCRKPRD